MRITELMERSVPYRLVGVSALEVFFRMPAGAVSTIETTAGIVELATIFDHVDFPGLPGWDALVRLDGRRILVRSVERFGEADGPTAHPLNTFSWDPDRRAFADPTGLYESLAEARGRLMTQTKAPVADADVEPVPVDGMDGLTAAIIAARFPLVPAGYPRDVPTWSPEPGAPGLWHRLILEQILTGRFAWRGLDILYRSGYVEEALPELAPMNRTDHSKEGHPEGNVWRHSLETLKYRKTPAFSVSLALLLHDSGKPFAEPDGHRRFNAHAEIGADLARKLMERLEMSSEEISTVGWLVRHHMMPGALERLPDHRRDPIMASPLFPQLLEVYRCDLSSTFRGPDGYYRACRVYRRYLKRARHNRDEHRVRRLVDLYVE